MQRRMIGFAVAFPMNIALFVMAEYAIPPADWSYWKVVAMLTGCGAIAWAASGALGEALVQILLPHQDLRKILQAQRDMKAKADAVKTHSM